jgi:hypothetical protein
MNPKPRTQQCCVLIFMAHNEPEAPDTAVPFPYRDNLQLTDREIIVGWFIGFLFFTASEARAGRQCHY